VFKFSIEASTADEFRAKLIVIHSIITGTFTGSPDLAESRTISNIMLSKSEELPSETKKENTEVSPKKIQSQRVKSVKPSVALVETVPADSAPEIVQIEKPATKADAMAMLQELNVAKGMEAARNVLTTFGCKRMSDVTEAQYQAFIEACKLALN
jgi:hypothetical protein